jgi:hypothetical protein
MPTEAARPSRSPRRRDARSAVPTVHDSWGRDRRRGRRDGHRIGRVVPGIGRYRRRARQEKQRIEVALLVRRQPDSEMDVRVRQFRLAARADGAHEGSLGDRLPSPHGVRAQMHERDGVSVLGPDRHGLSARGHPTRERDRARHRGGDRAAALGADVDSSMLARRVRVFAVEREEGEHRAADGPGPAESGRRNDQRGSEGR